MRSARPLRLAEGWRSARTERASGTPPSSWAAVSMAAERAAADRLERVGLPCRLQHAVGLSVAPHIDETLDLQRRTLRVGAALGGVEHLQGLIHAAETAQGGHIGSAQLPVAQCERVVARKQIDRAQPVVPGRLLQGGSGEIGVRVGIAGQPVDEAFQFVEPMEAGEK